MKRDQILSAVVGAVLAFLLSFGAMSCLVTGFSLDAGLWDVGFACLLFAVGSAGCYLMKRGGVVILCFLALLAGFLWRTGTLVGSFSSLLYDITRRYDGAYGWGTIGVSAAETGAAVKILGGLIAICVSWTISRRKNGIYAVEVSLLPLLACLVVTDTVPSEGSIFILLLGLIILLLTNNLRRISPSQANSLSAMVAVPVALALGLLFLVAPKEGYVNQSQEFQDTVLLWLQNFPDMVENISQEAISSIEDTTHSESVNLENQGPRDKFTYPVMDVLSPKSGTLYLREQDYDSYDGTGWVATDRRSEEFGRDETLDWEFVGTLTITTRRTRDVLYYPYYPGNAVTLIGGAVANENKTSAYEIQLYDLPDNWRELTTYRENVDEGEIVFGVGTESTFTQRYLNLPRDTKKWAEELLDEILTDEQTATEKAEAIARYVRSSADYSLDTEKMDGDYADFAMWFLEESDTGYCVHFATATAVLLRAAGVQSRYVTGYMAYGINGQKVTVTAGEAHAWAEYYEPILGVWIPLESTPGDGLTQAPNQTETQGSEELEDTEPGETEPGETEYTDGDGRQDDTMEETSGGSANGTDSPGGEKPELGWLGRILVWLAVIIGLAAAVVGQCALRRNIRRRRCTRGRANARALAMWHEAELCGKLLKQPVPWRLEELAQKAKYSQHTLLSSELAEFDQYLRGARAKLRSGGLHMRLIYTIIYAMY